MLFLLMSEHVQLWDELIAFDFLNKAITTKCFFTPISGELYTIFLIYLVVFYF